MVTTQISVTDQRSGNVGEIAYKASDGAVLTVVSRPSADGWLFQKTASQSYQQNYVLEFSDSDPAPGQVHTTALTFPTLTQSGRARVARLRIRRWRTILRVFRRLSGTR